MGRVGRNRTGKNSTHDFNLLSGEGVMSVVSGLAVASGVSSLLNAPGRTSTDAASRERSDGTAAVRVDSSVERIVERVAGVSKPSDQTQAPVSQTGLAPGSSRYSQFVEAVQALRLDKSDAAELTPGRVAELKAAAEEVFQMRADIPRDQCPSEVFEEQRQREVERKARAIAEQDQAASRAEATARAERAATGQSVSGETGQVSEAVASTPEVPAPGIRQAAPEPEIAIADQPEAKAIATPTTPEADAVVPDTIAAPEPARSAPEPV